LSSTVAFSNSSMFWNVRAMPSCATACAGTSVMSRSSKWSRPAFGA